MLSDLELIEFIVLSSILPMLLAGVVSGLLSI